MPIDPKLITEGGVGDDPGYNMGGPTLLMPAGGRTSSGTVGPASLVGQAAPELLQPGPDALAQADNGWEYRNGEWVKSTSDNAEPEGGEGLIQVGGRWVSDEAPSEPEQASPPSVMSKENYEALRSGGPIYSPLEERIRATLYAEAARLGFAYDEATEFANRLGRKLLKEFGG